MVHCRGEISSVIVLPGCSCSGSPAVPEWVQEFVAEENTADNSTLVHTIWWFTAYLWPVEIMFWNLRFDLLVSVVVSERSDHWCHPAVCVHCIYDSLLCLSVAPFRFILVFSCLVLSVFSTIPAHQDFSSYCLLILVRNRTTVTNHFLPTKCK